MRAIIFWLKVQNLTTKNHKKNSRKGEKEVKVELIKCLMETHEEHDYATLDEMFENATGFQDPTGVIRVYEEIIKSQKKGH